MTTLPLMRTLAACLIALSNLLLVGHAQSAACDAPALGSAGYARALNAVRRVPELVAWSRSHSFPVAYGESMDRQVRLQGRCYWSVSVFANRPERLELWNVFYVEAVAKGKSSRRMLVQDSASGEAVTLQQWRAEMEPS